MSEGNSAINVAKALIAKAVIGSICWRFTVQIFFEIHKAEASEYSLYETLPTRTA